MNQRSLPLPARLLAATVGAGSVTGAAKALLKILDKAPEVALAAL